jgi:predicted SAM-dependent methyltransferase
MSDNVNELYSLNLFVCIKRGVKLLLGRSLTDKIVAPFYRFIAQIRTWFRLRSLPPNNILLQIGCGYRPFNDWINLDVVHGYAEIVWDIRKSLPFKCNSVLAIYCEHVIEHLSQTEASYLLSECYRVLQPAGVARFSTPDAEKYFISYVNKDEFLRMPCFGASTTPRIDIINKLMRENGEHKWIYDEESLTKAFIAAGFSNVVRSSFGQSLCTSMINLDAQERSFESLYVEAVK